MQQGASQAGLLSPPTTSHVGASRPKEAGEAQGRCGGEPVEGQSRGSRSPIVHFSWVAVLARHPARSEVESERLHVSILWVIPARSSEATTAVSPLLIVFRVSHSARKGRCGPHLCPGSFKRFPSSLRFLRSRERRPSAQRLATAQRRARAVAGTFYLTRRRCASTAMHNYSLLMPDPIRTHQAPV